MLDKYTIELTYDDLTVISMALGQERYVEEKVCKDAARAAEIKALQDKITGQMVKQFWNRDAKNQ